MPEMSVTLWMDHAAPWLNRVQNNIENAVGNLSERVSSVDLHLTLYHGEVPDINVQELASQATGFLMAEDRFPIKLGPVNSMVTPSGRRVIYVEAHSGRLEMFQKRMNALFEAGGGQQSNEFIPHVSLAFMQDEITPRQIDNLKEIDGFKVVLVGTVNVSVKTEEGWHTLSGFRMFVDIDDAEKIQTTEPSVDREFSEGLEGQPAGFNQVPATKPVVNVHIDAESVADEVLKIISDRAKKEGGSFCDV